MKGLYDVARHLVWLTQFGLSVVVPPTLCIAGSVWLRHRFTLGGWVVAVGVVMAMGNFLSLSITVSNAMNRAANGGSPQKAQLEIQTSSVVRPVILVIIYILLFRAELCDPLAAILPLLFAQFCIKLIDFFRPDSQAAQKTKDGDSTP